MVEHPDARDTIDGIATWWQPGSDVWPAPELSQVLDFLTARGWVVVRDVAQGVRLYGANTKNLADMRRYLGEIQGSPQAGDKE